MLVELSEAVEAIDPAIVGANPTSLAEAFATFDRLRSRLADAVGRFDVDGLWAGDDATSMTAWLRGFAGLSGRSAGGWVMLARRLRRLPATAAALADGRLSHDQVQAVLANVEPDLVDAYVESEADLVAVLAPLDVADVAMVMQRWRARARAARPDPSPPEERRALRLSPLPDGTWRLDGDLGVEGGAIVDRAIRTATTPDAEGEPLRSAPERRADALTDICRRYLDQQARPITCRRRPHVDAIMPLGDLIGDGPGATINGQVLAAQAIQRWTCDATVSRVLVRGASHVLDYGTATRVVPTAVFLALVARDRHCRWPGCDRTPDWCEAHHLLHWTRGGATDLSNLALLCSRHHHRLHHPDWSAKLDVSDASLTITMADGRILASRPPPLVDVPITDSG